MAKAKVQITDRDKGWDALLRETRKTGMHATAGIHGDERSRAEGTIGNVLLAAVHEFGSRTNSIPERSFIRKTVDDEKKAYRKMLVKLGGKIYADGLKIHKALDIAGLKLASDMRRTIDRQPGSWPALKPATIARKGSAKKLIDRRELLQAIKHKVSK